MNERTISDEACLMNDQLMMLFEDWGIDWEIKLIGHGKYFDDDKDSRDIYQLSLNGQVSFKFGQSLMDSAYLEQPRGALLTRFKGRARRKPVLADIMHCLVLDYSYGSQSFSNFCSEFGEDEDSRKAYKIFKATQEVAQDMDLIFSADQIEEMQGVLQDY